MIETIIENKNLIPNHQFEFHVKHSTVDQIHRITNFIKKALEEQKIYTAVFLDITQAFDKVWHAGLIGRLKTMLPNHFKDILKSYLSEKYFRIKHDNVFSELKEINQKLAGVSQGSVLGTVLNLLSTSDIPTRTNNMISTFADDKINPYSKINQISRK